MLQLFRSVSSCPNRRDGLFVDTSLQQLNELATMGEVFIKFAQQEMKVFSGFVLPEDLRQKFFECFVASVSSGLGSPI